MKNEYKIAACYIRVSTEEQLDYSPDAQLREIRDYCNKNKIILKDEYIFIDEGISAKNSEKRLEFQRMIASAKKKPKPFDLILVHKFDRFSRNREDAIVYKSLLRKKLKIDVISIKEDVGTDKNGMLLEGMLDVLAEYYSLNLADEVKKGQMEKVRKGGNVNSMAVGYIKDGNGGMIIDKEKSWWIKIVFQDYVDGLGRRKIAQHMESLGITTTGNKKPLSQDRIRYILNNPVYAGYIRRSTNGRLSTKFNSSDWFVAKGIHEAIISEELWEKTQKINQNNLLMYKKIDPDKEHHWLCGRMVKCSSCGGGLVKYKSRGVEYLQCAHYFNGQCKVSHSIKLERIEKAVLNQLKIDFTEDILINITEKSYSEDDLENVKIIENQIEKIQLKKERVKQAYINQIDTIDEYKENKNKLSLEEKNLKEEYLKLKSKINKKIDVTSKKNDIKNLYNILIDIEISKQKKYEISHIIFEKIVYNKKEEKLFIYYN